MSFIHWTIKTKVWFKFCETHFGLLGLHIAITLCRVLEARSHRVVVCIPLFHNDIHPSVFQNFSVSGIALCWETDHKYCDRPLLSFSRTMEDCCTKIETQFLCTLTGNTCWWFWNGFEIWFWNGGFEMRRILVVFLFLNRIRNNPQENSELKGTKFASLWNWFIERILDNESVRSHLNFLLLEFFWSGLTEGGI